jgi:long-chain acyl-CoA synthetase
MDDIEDTRFISYTKLIEEGEKLLSEGDKIFTEATIDPEEMTILLFTSGTTAKSKAVMLCQRNICKNLMSMFSMLYIDRNDVFFSVLPLHHTYECTCGFLGQVYRGTTIAICSGLRYITSEIKEAKPSCILMVPVMLEMFYKNIMKNIMRNIMLLKNIMRNIMKNIMRNIMKNIMKKIIFLQRLMKKILLKNNKMKIHLKNNKMKM